MLPLVDIPDIVQQLCPFFLPRCFHLKPFSSSNAISVA